MKFLVSKLVAVVLILISIRIVNIYSIDIISKRLHTCVHITTCHMIDNEKINKLLESNRYK